MPDAHVYYGVGGCAVLGRDYQAAIAQPWREFRKFATGSPNKPLHAYEFGRNAASDQLEALGGVLRNNGFMRVGVVGATTTELPKDLTYKKWLSAVPEEEHLAWMVIRDLPKRILDVARWTQFQSIAWIIEQNPRSKKLIQSALHDFAFEENGKKIPMAFYFMPKSAKEPGLEVADFVANAIAGHARSHLVEHRAGFRKDFTVVFQGVSEKLSSFLAITSIDYEQMAQRE